MQTRNRWVRLVICLGIGTVWLASCGRSPTLQSWLTAASPGRESPPTLATAELLPTASEPPPPATEPIRLETPSPGPPTSTTTPPPAYPTALLSPRIAEAYYEDRTGPVPLLASYYNAINRQDYPRAWDYWEHPPSPSYESFVQGFANTASVLLAVRPPTGFEGAAGSTYTSIPALLSATHWDGSRHNFAGCFVVRRPKASGVGPEQAWSLFNATVHRTPGNTTLPPPERPGIGDRRGPHRQGPFRAEPAPVFRKTTSAPSE